MTQLVRVVVAVVGAAAACVADAGIVRVLNDGAFHWTAQVPSYELGHSFDVTQGVGQPTGANDRTFWYQIPFRDSSTTVAADIINRSSWFGGGGMGQIARSLTPFLIHDPNAPGGTRYTYPAAHYGPGQAVGPTGVVWQTYAVFQEGGFGRGQIPIGHTFLGISFPAADGIHYGFIEVNDTAAVPLSWGYESEPGVPAVIPFNCGSADFNCDGDAATDEDIEAFFACIAGACPPAPCRLTSDFNGDGDSATDLDIEAFFRVLAGGSC
jgi:hypothetical protein